MNRRRFLSGLLPTCAALPAVAASGNNLKPPVTATPICGACHSDMLWDSYPELRGEHDIDWKSRQMVYCVAPYCPQFEVKVRAYPQ